MRRGYAVVGGDYPRQFIPEGVFLLKRCFAATLLRPFVDTSYNSVREFVSVPSGWLSFLTPPQNAAVGSVVGRRYLAVLVQSTGNR